MSDVYKRLAERLDGLPNGFPATESGVELKILQKIFTPEDAEMALKLKPIPETVETVAQRLGKPVPEMRTILDDMAKKGQIGCLKLFGEQVYMLVPFVVGIYEFQINRLDKELAQLVEEYAPVLSKAIGGYEPALARTVPVNMQIETKTQVQPYENLRKMIEEAKSFNLMECICRKERALEGHPCNHSLETCLQFSNEEGAYDYFKLSGRIISKEEAIKVLDKAEDEGLVHNVFYNVREGHFAVCNCCACSCGVFRAMKEFKAPHALAKSNFVAIIDQDSCSECGVCAEERCPVDAIIEQNGGYKVLPDVCIGCGVCTVTCPTESIALIDRPESEQDLPPNDMIDWTMKRAANRGIDFKLE
jgi:NAD-dependent dihydropyrimidine dehydrogenase PreA subunit